jgi:hypothetical protein
MIHHLKTWSSRFDAMMAGAKRFEFRRDDRWPAFALGDVLILQSYNEDLGDYLPGVLPVGVTHIERAPSFGIPAGFCCMSIRPRREQYDEWIAERCPTAVQAAGNANQVSSEMIAIFPELAIVRGWIKIHGWRNSRAHIWCVDLVGQVVDPTAAQFLSPIEGYTADPGSLAI